MYLQLRTIFIACKTCTCQGAEVLDFKQSTKPGARKDTNWMTSVTEIAEAKLDNWSRFHILTWLTNVGSVLNLFVAGITVSKLEFLELWFWTSSLYATTLSLQWSYAVGTRFRLRTVKLYWGLQTWVRSKPRLLPKNCNHCLH